MFKNVLLIKIRFYYVPMYYYEKAIVYSLLVVLIINKIILNFLVTLTKVLTCRFSSKISYISVVVVYHFSYILKIHCTIN